MRLAFSSRHQSIVALFAIAAAFLAAGSAFAYEAPELDDLGDRIARRADQIATDPPQGEVLLLDSLPAPEGRVQAG